MDKVSCALDDVAQGNRNNGQAIVLSEEVVRLRTRVAELEAILRTLHDCIDREMGDSDLDGDPLVEAMGAAMRLLSTPKGGKAGEKQ